VILKIICLSSDHLVKIASLVILKHYNKEQYKSPGKKLMQTCPVSGTQIYPVSGPKHVQFSGTSALPVPMDTVYINQHL